MSAPSTRTYRRLQHGERIRPGDQAILNIYLVPGKYTLQSPVESSAWIEACQEDASLDGFLVGITVPSYLTIRRLVAPTFWQRVSSSFRHFFSRTP